MWTSLRIPKRSKAMQLVIHHGFPRLGGCGVARVTTDMYFTGSAFAWLVNSTRVGAAVNEVRKKTADVFPVVSKRCRALIKAWQKLVEVRPASSTTSSANGTPNLVSPSIAKLSRRVTPCTPVNRRITSTGLAGSAASSATVSPANGSYAPKQLTSPSNGVIHKSQSVGADLAHSGDDPRNGKRKLDDGNCTSLGILLCVGPPTYVSRTSIEVSCTLAGVVDIDGDHSKVAELSQNLPEHMSIDSSIREHEERVKREQQDEEYAMQLYGGASTSTPYSQPERKKRKYERKLKTQEAASEASPVSSVSGRFILRLPRVAPIKEETEAEDVAQEPPRHVSSAASSRPESVAAAGPSGTTNTNSRGKVDWLAMLPSLEELREKADQMKAEREQLKNSQHHPTKAYLIRVKDRDVLALPYLDVPTVPDFIQYRYPNPTQYYAEENFLYGAPRNT
ncbi:unnamed protein product [Nippostrongylus brasiliensis]|uniref:TFIIS N-terminal domain-containing protein n=1 Tax=Nippostrongylus brasiliensis TaxID=27835 RepID=A0A0N4Y4M7_NIPBR|nr:unnamed protein product [Nippostrongylus brasiliensis]